MSLRWLFLFLLPLTLGNCSGEPRSYAKETGPSTFLRDFDQAAAQSGKSDKPIFALFQEVPG